MNYDARIDTAEENGEAVPFNPLDQADGGDRRARRRIYIVVAIAVVLLTLLWFWLHRKPADIMEAGGTSQAAAVTVMVPGRATISGTITGTGTLAARRELPVGSVGEGGQVAQVLVEPGQWVRQGQVLAVIDRSVQTQQLASQTAQIQVAQADARLAQANLDRALQLVDRGFISKADVDRLTATRDAAAARVRVAGAQANELQARIRRLNITAPAAGLVLERKAEPGQVVTSGSGVLFRIAKGGEMELLAQLSEDDLAKLSPGAAAEVTPVGSDRKFTGEIWQLSPVINPQTRQGTARIALAYAPELRPGGFASVEIRSGTLVAPMLPESAVLADNAGNYVYIVGANNKVERRNVKTGLLTANGIAIVAGLSGSERVVQRAGAFLQPGETVNPKVAR